METCFRFFPLPHWPSHACSTAQLELCPPAAQCLDRCTAKKIVDGFELPDTQLPIAQLRTSGAVCISSTYNCPLCFFSSGILAVSPLTLHPSPGALSGTGGAGDGFAALMAVLVLKAGLGMAQLLGEADGSSP